MSKLSTQSISCPYCAKTSEQTVWNSINTSVDDAAQKILDDQINQAFCLPCLSTFRIDAPLLFNNMQKQYAVYYHPTSFDAINQEAEGLKKMFGNNFYLAHPFKHHDWELFKEEIRKQESRPVVNLANNNNPNTPTTTEEQNPKSGIINRLGALVLISILVIVGLGPISLLGFADSSSRPFAILLVVAGVGWLIYKGRKGEL